MLETKELAPIFVAAPLRACPAMRGAAEPAELRGRRSDTAVKPNQTAPLQKIHLTCGCRLGKNASIIGVIGASLFQREMGVEIRLAEVRLQDGESLENALRRFKRKVQQEDIIKEIKKHSFYLKPGEKKRVKAALARKRARKKAKHEQD